MTNVADLGRAVGLLLSDKQYRETRVDKVESAANGWSVTCADGWSLLVGNDECSVAPSVGERMIQFGKGIGYTVRGVVIGNRVYRYKTEAQERADNAEYVKQQSDKRRESYEAKRAEFDARVSALPDPLRIRINRFRVMRGNEWRYEFEPYELFTCEQAAVLHSAMTDGRIPDAQAFAALPWAEQKALVSGIDDGHSGNTLGAALRLATLLRDRPDLVPQEHGAMCPLVGCEEYGCWSATGTQPA